MESNSKIFTNCLPGCDIGKTNCKVLGTTWNSVSDTLSINNSFLLSDQFIMITKRTVLQQIASIFDPLELFSPVILKVKEFF